MVNSCQIADGLAGLSHWNTSDSGAIVIGGDYRALGTVRSLGRHNIPVWVLTDDHMIAGVSRYARRRLRWPAADEQARIEYLLEISVKHDLRGWVLFPSSDETAAAVARNHAVLSQRFRLTIPPWEVLQWAYDKRLTYRLAESVGVDYPWTRVPADRAEVAGLHCQFPLVLKPAIKPQLNAFTSAKAWRVDDRKSLLASYDEACTMVDPGVIMIQELIPGGGQEQFSYAALCLNGRPLATLVARRTRQYPVDFGRASTFVETVHQPEVEEAGRRLVSHIGFTGIVEVEFKRDPRDSVYKLLDVNPRIWGWHTLGRRAGVDFSYLLWRLLQGDSFSEISGRPGVRWLRLATDVAAGIDEMRHGRLSIRVYLKSIWGPVESAIFAADDPLPALLEAPLGVYLLWRRGWV